MSMLHHVAVNDMSFIHADLAKAVVHLFVKSFCHLLVVVKTVECISS